MPGRDSRLAGIRFRRESTSARRRRSSRGLRPLGRKQMKAQQTASELAAEFLNDNIPVEKKAAAPSQEQLIKDVEAFLGESRPDSNLAAQPKP